MNFETILDIKAYLFSLLSGSSECHVAAAANSKTLAVMLLTTVFRRRFPSHESQEIGKSEQVFRGAL